MIDRFNEELAFYLGGAAVGKQRELATNLRAAADAVEAGKDPGLHLAETNDLVSRYKADQQDVAEIIIDVNNFVFSLKERLAELGVEEPPVVDHKPAASVIEQPKFTKTEPGVSYTALFLSESDREEWLMRQELVSARLGLTEPADRLGATILDTPLSRLFDPQKNPIGYAFETRGISTVGHFLEANPEVIANLHTKITIEDIKSKLADHNIIAVIEEEGKPKPPTVRERLDRLRPLREALGSPDNFNLTPEQAEPDFFNRLFDGTPNISNRTYNALKRSQIHTLPAFLRFSEDALLSSEMRLFGQKALIYMLERIEATGITPAVSQEPEISSPDIES